MNDRSHLEEAARILRLMRDARDEPDSARAYRFMMAAAKRHTEWLQADAAIATAPAWRPGLGDWVRPKGNHEHEAGRVTAIRWDTQYPIAVRWYPSGTTGGWMASDLEPATPSAQESSANPSNSSNSSPPEATPTSPCETCGDPVEHLVPRFCHIHEPPSADDWEPGIVGARLDVEQERAHSACLGGHPLYRCRRCGCPVTDHATDDEERRECTACECEQYEMCPGCAQQQASPERGTGGEDFEPPCGRCKGRGVMWHERLERDVLCTYCQTKPVANAAKVESCTCPEEHETHLVGCPLNCGHPDCSSCDQDGAGDRIVGADLPHPAELADATNCDECHSLDSFGHAPCPRHAATPPHPLYAPVQGDRKIQPGRPGRYCGRLNVEAELAAEQLRELRERRLRPPPEPSAATPGKDASDAERNDDDRTAPVWR